MPTAVVITRFTNSTNAWYDAGATIELSVQRGQVGQPRPDEVSRTAPPVTTIAPSNTAAATVSRRKVVAEIDADMPLTV